MSITVFLVDDHAIIRDGLQLLLEAQSDIKVIGVAGNGVDAVQQLSQLCPDVVIVDIALPGLNGIDVVQRVREDCPTTRCLILSMHSTSEHIFRALRAGALGYLLKESAGREVVDAVYAVHAGQKYLSQKIEDTVISDFVSQHSLSSTESPLERLSPREREILKLVVDSLSSHEIADKLSLSPKTVDTYRSRLMGKLGISDLPSLVKFAIQHGLTSID